MRTANYNTMSEEEKILHILDIMGAVSPETGITTETLVGKGIEEGATKDVFTEYWHGHKEGDHPWWLLLAAMSGTGSEEEVAKHNTPHLFRKKVSATKNGRKTNVYVYWYDETQTHEIHYTGKAYREKMEKIEREKKIWEDIKNAVPGETPEQKRQNPAYIEFEDGRFVLKSWLINNPEKGKKIYSKYFLSHPEVYTELYGNM